MKLGLLLSVVTACQLVSCSARSSRCGGRNIKGVIVEDKLFYMETSFEANFFHAFEYCKSIGMRLAVINSSEEEVALHAYAEKIEVPDWYWISGNDLAKNNTYNWMSTGEPMLYHNFRGGEPSHFSQGERVEEHCIMLELHKPNQITWNDLRCDEEHHFICEIDCNDE